MFLNMHMADDFGQYVTSAAANPPTQLSHSHSPPPLSAAILSRTFTLRMANCRFESVCLPAHRQPSSSPLHTIEGGVAQVQ